MVPPAGAKADRLNLRSVLGLRWSPVIACATIYPTAAVGIHAAAAHGVQVANASARSRLPARAAKYAEITIDPTTAGRLASRAIDKTVREADPPALVEIGWQKLYGPARDALSLIYWRMLIAEKQEQANEPPT